MGEEQAITEAALSRDLNLAFQAFMNDPLVTIPIEDAKKLFDEMIQNTPKYMQDYRI